MVVKSRSKKRSPLIPPELKKLVQWLAGPGRPLTLAVLLAGLFFGGFFGVWKVVRNEVLLSDSYWLTRDHVEITPPADWIHSDILDEVFRDASLDEPLSIMAEDLTERIANAFSLHPWVAEVRRVTKHQPAGVNVDLVYRRPVCMVDVPGRLLPVDIEGVLLPADDFSRNEAVRYPRLVGIETVAVGPVGTRWGDVRVVGGAEIAAAFGAVWNTLGLDRIVPSRLVDMGRGGENTYTLVTRSGTEILWGRAPGAATPGEAPAADKVAWLKTYHAEQGTLEGVAGPQQLDLRDVPSRLRTVGKPGDGRR